jgi:hypothetical protein
MEWQVPGCGEDGRWVDPPIGLSSNGSSCRAECRSRLCARHGPTPHLHRATVGFVGSGAEPIESIEGIRRPKWRVCCKVGALARSPYPLAPTHQPLQLCAAPQTHTRARGDASRLCRTGSRSRLCAVVRSRVRPSSGGTALNKNSSRLHAMLTSKVRRGGRTCKMQHARCSAAVPG